MINYFFINKKYLYYITINTKNQKISNITKNPIPPQFQTTKSITKFIKNINRIKFNNISNKIKSFLTQKKFYNKKNSKSYPNLNKITITKKKTKNQISRSISTTFKQSSIINLPKIDNIKNSKRTSTPNTETNTTKTTNITINLTSNIINNIAYQKINTKNDKKKKNIINLLKSILIPTKITIYQKYNTQYLTNKSPNKSNKIIYKNIIILY